MIFGNFILIILTILLDIIFAVLEKVTAVMPDEIVDGLVQIASAFTTLTGYFQYVYIIFQATVVHNLIQAIIFVIVGYIVIYGVKILLFGRNLAMPGTKAELPERHR